MDNDLEIMQEYVFHKKADMLRLVGLMINNSKGISVQLINNNYLVSIVSTIDENQIIKENEKQ